MPGPLTVCYPFVGDNVGGSHLSTLTLIESLQGGPVRPLIAVHEEGLLTEYLRERGIPFEKTPTVRIARRSGLPVELKTMLGATLPLAAFLRRNSVSIVHTNDMRMHMTWLLAAKYAGTKFVWHQRSAATSRRLGVYSLAADQVITISESCRTMLTHRMKKRARIVKNPFRSTQPLEARPINREKLLQELGASDDAAIVAFVGNIEPHKRPEVFVRMAAELRQRLGKPLWFPMFGQPRDPTASRLRQLIDQLGMTDRCILMGPRYPIEPLMSGSDVLVAPAVREGFGRSLVEAMLVGTPVVASADGGHQEIITNEVNGILVEPENHGAFCEAVADLLTDPHLCNRLAIQAYSEAADKYSPAHHADLVLSIYEELTG